MRRAALAAVVLGLGWMSGTAEAQRLPQTATPEHYALTLTPDLQSTTFHGQEKLDLVLAAPAATITLNAVEIDFKSVSAETKSGPVPATVSLDPGKEQATLTFARQLPSGPVTLDIDYSGKLNNELRGFYLSKTAKRNYAVTQFESTDARRAFPSFDEPEMKATFDVTLVVDAGDNAISNTNVISDAPGPSEGKRTIRFATTPKMSTYLVAFLVGDFQCLKGESEGVPIRVCAPPDKVQLGGFALAGAEHFLHYYNHYFGIPYPMPKLDMIALPDFEAGAMENFGAITYRETALLVDDKTASVSALKNVAVDVAHEMAHQWFGDMVTMRWWDNLWLNEGFATWMEDKAVGEWKPEWKVSESEAADLDATLSLDARPGTRAIRARAETPAEINEMFDAITYDKAGAMLRMVEHYEGEESFRRGVHNYLSAHMYGNATAEDFWTAQTAVSHKPVDRVIQSMISLPGAPILIFGDQGPDGKTPVRQERFRVGPAPAADGAPPVWTLPVCVKTAGCTLLETEKGTVPSGSAPFFFADANGRGYYRSSYAAANEAKLRAAAETALTPEERIRLLGDSLALVMAQRAPVGSFLDLAGAMHGDDSFNVVDVALTGVHTVAERIAATEDDRVELAAWIRKNFSGALERLGPPSATDSPERRSLRARLFEALGGEGRDEAVIAQAKEIATRYLANPASEDANLGQEAVRIAASNGDAAFFAVLVAHSRDESNPQNHWMALEALARFRDPGLERKALDYAVSGQVRNQDSMRLISQMLSARETQAVAWKYVQENWEKIKAQTTIFSGEQLVNSTGRFCTEERRADAAQFFSVHTLPATDSALRRAQARSAECIALRAGQEQKLEQWLSPVRSHGGR